MVDLKPEKCPFCKSDLVIVNDVQQIVQHESDCFLWPLIIGGQWYSFPPKKNDIQNLSKWNTRSLEDAAFNAGVEQAAQEQFEKDCKVVCEACAGVETHHKVTNRNNSGSFYHRNKKEVWRRIICKASTLREAWEKKHG